ncbi:hypothetical protein BH11BAC3_BH11BAC3_43840 [soil metagenome]
MLKPITSFFANSEELDFLVLRPLSHINIGWELTWDSKKNHYIEEDGNFSKLLNDLVSELGKELPPTRYHDNEDTLAEYVKQNLNWDMHKIGSHWTGGDYETILTQGGFSDIDEKNLVTAAAGRIKAAMDFGQAHFDDMEKSHKKILTSVLTIILYHRFTEI